MSSIYEIFIGLVVFLIALSFHECAHAYTAYLLGDSTAKQLGRVTLNPLKHLDPVGTILIIIVNFGWGKPVPVNPKYFKHPKRDSALVSLAGPMANLFLALIAITAIKYLPENILIVNIMNVFIGTNLVLAVFNLLPIPPLDGSHVLAFFIPEKYNHQWENFAQNSAFILLALVLADNFFHWGFLTDFFAVGVTILYNLLFSLT